MRRSSHEGVLDALGVGLARIGLDGRVFEANHAFARILGLPDRSVIERCSLLPFLPAGTRWDALVVGLRSQPDAASREGAELRLRHKDGSTVRVSWLGRVVGEGDEGVVELVLTGLPPRPAARAERGRARSRERRRLVTAIHGELAQLLAGLSIQAASLSRMEALAGGADDERALLVSRIEDLAREALQHAKDLARQGGGVAPQAEDLSGALNEAGREATRLYGVRASVDVDPAWPAGPHPWTPHLTSVAREAVGNAAVHGRATRVWVSMRAASDGWRLSIRDDGCGMPPGGSASGLGSWLMEECARRLSGSLALANAAEGGVEVALDLPRAGARVPGRAPRARERSR